MQTISFTAASKTIALPQGAVLAIGNFDGVHKGHLQLLETAKAIAVQSGAPAAVLTFEPHPRLYFQPKTPPFRLTPLRLKAALLESNGIDILYACAFDSDLAHMSAADFVADILKTRLNVSHVVIGPDFHFGKGRAGHAETLIAAGIKVTILDPVCDTADDVISATRIRGLLQEGDVGNANALLGWDWQIEGVVEKGDQRGRELGYPTANLQLGETQHPAYGIYAGYVQLPDVAEKWLPAIANIGIRPMFVAAQALVEAHIFDFSQDIYGQRLYFRPLKKLRDEARFNSLDELIVQMAEDCRQAKDIL